MDKRYLIFVGMFVLVVGLIGAEWHLMPGMVVGLAGLITMIGALCAVLLDPPERVDLDAQEEGVRRKAKIKYGAFQWWF